MFINKVHDDHNVMRIQIHAFCTVEQMVIICIR